MQGDYWLDTIRERRGILALEVGPCVYAHRPAHLERSSAGIEVMTPYPAGNSQRRSSRESTLEDMHLNGALAKLIPSARVDGHR
jgi:hypothetical protein